MDGKEEDAPIPVVHAAAIEPPERPSPEVRPNLAWSNSRSLPRSSLDHFVGTGEERLRHGEAERRRSLEVDHQLEFGRLLDRQIGRLGALQDLVHVDGATASYIDTVRPEAQEAACRRVLSGPKRRWQFVRYREFR